MCDDFGISVIMDSFHCQVYILPTQMERLNSSVTDGAILAAIYFNIRREILSEPQALDTCRPLSSCSTPKTVQHISSREASCGGGEDGSIRGTVRGG